MLGVTFIIIALATAVALIFNAFFAYLKGKSNVDLLKKHIDAGHPLDSEILLLVNKDTGSGMSDIRKTVLLIMVGGGGAIFSNTMANLEDAHITLGISMFALVVGVGYLVSAVIEKKMSQ